MNIFYYIISMFFYISRNQKNNDKEEDALDKNYLLCRFVLDGLGEKVGESIAIDDDLMIIKSGKNYLGVPLKHIDEREEGKTLLVKGLLDKDKAKEMGEKWREKSLSKMFHDNGE